MVRVKEDYFKGGESFFKSPELSELIDDMDANGVERAVLMSSSARPRAARCRSSKRGPSASRSQSADSTC